MTDSINHPHQWFGGRCYSQHGDEFVVLNIFKRLDVRPSYIDIGAHHPFDLSNTALMYLLGCRGINVEANPDMIPHFVFHRPEDTTVHAAVTTFHAPASVRFYRGKEPGVSSVYQHHVQPFGIANVIDVPTMTADAIVDKYANGKWPDFMSIDAEGSDAAIIADIDWDARKGPKVICVEAQSVSGGSSAATLRSLLGAVGYYVHSWAGNNMIFVRIELREWLH